MLGLALRWRSVCSDRRLLSSLATTSFAYSSFSWSARARALGSTPALAAARSSYRPAAKAHERTAKLLRLHSRTDPPCSHRRRVALEGTSSPYTAMSTSGQGAVLDRMDTTTHPSPGPKGTEPPPSPGPRDEAGAADEGNRPGASHDGGPRIAVSRSFLPSENDTALHGAALRSRRRRDPPPDYHRRLKPALSLPPGGQAALAAKRHWRCVFVSS